MNNVYYDEEEQQRDFEQIKEVVDDRHDDISKDIQESNEEAKEDDNVDDETEQDSKTKTLTEGLLQTNEEWNALISTSSESFKESQAAKSNLIQELLSKY